MTKLSREDKKIGTGFYLTSDKLSLKLCLIHVYNAHLCFLSLSFRKMQQQNLKQQPSQQRYYCLFISVSARYSKHLLKIWLVGCFGFNGPLRQYFSLYRAISQRGGEREEKGQMRTS